MTAVEDKDIYSLESVRAILRMRTGGRTFITTQQDKTIMRLGDGIAIAILKLADEQQLADAKYLREILLILQGSFGGPELITEESNKRPRITMLLLDHLRQSTADPDLRAQIDKASDFIRKQSAGSTE